MTARASAARRSGTTRLAPKTVQTSVDRIVRGLFGEFRRPMHLGASCGSEGESAEKGGNDAVGANADRGPIDSQGQRQIAETLRGRRRPSVHDRRAEELAADKPDYHPDHEREADVEQRVEQPTTLARLLLLDRECDEQRYQRGSNAVVESALDA